jgi:hypothetical protein
MTSRHPNSSSQRVPAWNSAFNNRDIDGALELMTEDVNWHNASEGIRRQWSEFDPHVEPLAMVEEDGDKVRVTVHQLVKSLRGAVLPDSEVLHVFHCEQRPYRGHGPRGSDRSNRWSICRVRSSTSFATTGNSARTYYPPDLRRLLKSPRILFWGPGRT